MIKKVRDVFEGVDTRHELEALLSLAWPSYLISLSFTGIGLINSSVVGHLGTVYLASVAYSDIVMEYTLLLFLQGFNQGLRALSSQAFGARNYVLVGQYGQMALLCVTLSCLPLAYIWWNIGNVLQMVHTAPDTIYYATSYSRLSLFSLLPRMLYCVLSTYFVAQHIVIPTAIISVTFLAVHYLLNQTLIHGIGSWNGLGFIGCPLATATTMFLRLFTLIAYMFIYKQTHRQTWRWTLDFLSLKRLKLLVKIGVPLMLGNAFENSQLQVCALFAGSLGQVDLAAHSSMLQLFLTLSCPVFGLSSGAITRIGYRLGRGEPRSAQAVSLILLGCILTIASGVVLFYCFGRNYVGHLFSNDPLVWDLIRQICIIAALGYFFLSFFYFSMATLTGQARSLPILMAFLIGAWCVGVPSAYLLGIYWKIGLIGIWIGMSLGYIVTTTIGVTATINSNWIKEAERAQERASHKIVETTALID